jgi:energy-coupling factor transporter ATP-binding protein EcfA2
MRRVTTTLLIVVIGGLVLWEAISWGTRTWVKYGLMKQPLPSITALLPTSMILPIITTLLTTTIVIVVINGILRSRKLFGLIPLRELNRHVVLLGPTGSGKTTVAKAIIAKALMKSPNIQLIIIDWKGEYSPFLKGATVIRKIDNIWKNIPGNSPREKALIAIELLREMSKDVVEITAASSLLLLRVLEEEYRRGVPTTEKIIDILERGAMIAQREGKLAEANMYLALIRRLFILLVDEERKAENVRGSSELVVYDLGGLPSIYLKTLYASYVLASVYREATSMSDGLKTLLIAEEAQNYIHPRRANELPSLAERFIYELRAFGVGVILVCPDPELLPTPVLKDVGAVISTSPDTVPRFALERFLFRASLEEAENILKKLKSAKAIIYYKGNLHFLRRLPKPPKELRLRPKGDRMGVKPGVGSLRAWPILPHRSPGRLAPKVVEVREEAKELEVIEIREEGPKVVEVKTVPEELRLEEEEEPEVTVTEIAEKPAEEEKFTAEEPVESAVKIEEEVREVAKERTVEVKEEIEEKLAEEMPLEEPEPAPKGPPIPSTLPYRGSLCPAGRSTTLGRVLFEKEKNDGWWVSGRVGTEIPRRGSTHPRRRAGQSGAPA